MKRAAQNVHSPEVFSCVEQGGFGDEPGEVERWMEEAAGGEQEVVREHPGKTDSWERDDSACSQEEGKERACE